MNPLYKKIWDEAKPYYQKGRPMDIEHIEWMMEIVDEICKKEDLDETILMPLAILHDVGYATLIHHSTTNYYDTDIRKAHMQAGAEIAEKILKSVDYPEDKSKKIVKYVGIHDIWSLGEIEIYKKDKILGTFKDLDYLWIYTKKGCDAVKKTRQKSNSEMWKYLDEQTSPAYGKKPFSTLFVQQRREEYLKERRKELL